MNFNIDIGKIMELFVKHLSVRVFMWFLAISFFIYAIRWW